MLPSLSLLASSTPREPARYSPPLPARRVIKALQKLGFEVVGQRGSHVKLRHDDGRMVVVPDHGDGTFALALS